MARGSKHPQPIIPVAARTPLTAVKAAAYCVHGRRWWCAVVALAVASAAWPAQAKPTLGIAYGAWQEMRREQLDVSIASPFRTTWRGHEITLAWTVDVARWRSVKHADGGPDTLYEIGFAPRVRMLAAATPLGHPYVEAGIGLHALSGKRIFNHELGVPVLFGSFAGFGLRFGAREEFAVSAGAMHESNAGIKQPNHGLTVVLVRFEYALP